jgi:hypothetical protein
MEIKDIKHGMVFRYKSKHDNQYYTDVVHSLIYSRNPEDNINFIGKNGVAHRANRVEWLDEIREEKLDQLLK